LFKEAIEAYEKALEIKPDYYEAYYGIGVAYASSNKFKEAIEAYEEAIEIKLNSPHIVISFMTRLNLNGFFISLNCLLKLI
jgi:tetratricopeptide (TPR) repeat protein